MCLLHTHAHQSILQLRQWIIASRLTYLANGCANPRAMVVKALDAVVVHGAVMCTGRLEKVAGVVVTHRNTVAVDHNIPGPAGHISNTRSNKTQS
jgi:hypothetical protein